MTTRTPIYLVSACASGEQFVAAFRRYADKNGLFIPIVAPLPAGRRGRFAVTLADGGIMVEGEADIVSSSPTPSVLHGRTGMTLRFLEPDIKSKTVLVELEQARLAMKPQPPSVPPRPAQIPPEPRPKVPAITGRIDANNALAECVVIGDVSTLEELAPQAAKAGPKFTVPTIPPVAGAQRPKSPSTPPLAYSALEKQSPAPIAAQPRKPPAPVTPGSITTVDAPLPASVTPMSITTVNAPSITPTSMGVVMPPKQPLTSRSDATDLKEHEVDELAEPPVADERDTIAMTALPRAITSEAVSEGRDTIAMPALARTTSDDLTFVPQAREAGLFEAAVPPGSESDTISTVRAKNDSDSFPATPVPKADGVPEAVPSSPSSKSNGSTSSRMGLPPPRRTSGNTQQPRAPTPAQPMPVVKPRLPTPAQPMPVVKPTSPGMMPLKETAAASAPIATPRASPTRIGLPIVDVKSPAQPSGEIPLPPIVAEAKPPVPDVADEPTDITSVPVVVADSEREDAAAAITDAPPRRAARPSVPGGMRKTVMGVAVVPEGVTVLPAASSAVIATPTEEAIAAAPDPDAAPIDVEAKPEPPKQRAPVIEEPSGDWTMVPGATGPTILPRNRTDSAPPPDEAADKRLPAGDWTIARVEDSPDGWSEPSNVDVAPLEVEVAPVTPVRPNLRANTGPVIAAVAGEKPLEVTMTAKAFDIEEETKSGLPKIEVDASLRDERQTDSIDVGLASTQLAATEVQIMPVPGTLAPMASVAPVMRPMPPASHGSGNFQLGTRSSGPAQLFGVVPHGDEATSIVEGNRKKRLVIILASAAAVVVLGAALIVVFVLRKSDPKPSGTEVSQPVADPQPVTADAAEAVAVVVDAGALEPVELPAQERPPATDCVVDVSSTPAGAEILQGKDLLGTTPTKLTMPCDVQVKLVVRKARFASVARNVTPTRAGTKVRVPLVKTTLSVKVTSSPPGASIMLGGKSLGVTPAMVKLPAMEAATLVISKPGFSPDTQKITPKQNNQSVHVTLKKKGR